MNTPRSMGLNREGWRLSYDAEKLLETTARDLLKEICDLGLCDNGARAVRDGARQILIQEDLETRKKATTKVLKTLACGNEGAQIHAIWLADIWVDYAAQQQHAAIKMAA